MNIEFPEITNAKIENTLNNKKQSAKERFSGSLINIINTNKKYYIVLRDFSNRKSLTEFLLFPGILLMGIFLIFLRFLMLDVKSANIIVIGLGVLYISIIISCCSDTRKLNKRLQSVKKRKSDYEKQLVESFTKYTGIACDLPNFHMYDFYDEINETEKEINKTEIEYAINEFLKENEYQLLLGANYDKNKYCSIFYNYKKTLQKIDKILYANRNGAETRYRKIKHNKHKYYIVLDEYISGHKVDSYELFILDDSVQDKTQILASLFAKDEWLNFKFIDDFFREVHIY
ncbi:MAG: hypothetical protein VZS44_10275 [Bacilli bacterium]|nr:hypothetical protein [Bacilli bacterium]